MSKQCEDEHQQTESDLSSDSTDVSLSTEPTSTELEPSFSIETSLLPDQLICENDLVAEQETEVLPQPLIIDSLIGELNAVEEDLSSPDVNESLLAEQEVTTQEILDSYGDNQTIALDFEESEGDESFDSTEVPLSGHNQIQQLLLEPVQELEEQELLTDTSDASQVESEVLEQESQPISEDEWIEQERIGLEIRDSQLDLPESSLDQIFEEPYTQEHLEQLVSDYREAFEQCSVLDQDQEPQQDDLGTPITEAERPIHAEQEDSPPALESTSTPSLETILSVNAPPSYFTPQESVSSRLFSELCLVEASPDLSSNRMQPLEPEISPLEDYLASLDSPRLLEQFHVQMQEDVTQLLLLDEANSLPNLEELLELVSEGPTLPTPPPYDFLQDLEDQEEANQHASPTRSHLLRSLEQARLRQEVANYQFALQNLPDSQKQPRSNPQIDSSKNNVYQFDFLNKNDPLNNTIEGTKDNPSNQGLNHSIKHFPYKSKYPWNDRPRRDVKLQKQTIESNIPSDQPGFYSSLAHHIIQLQRGGTAIRLDSAIRTQMEKMKVIDRIIHDEWRQATNIMSDLIDKYQIKLDSQIVERIHQLIRQECRIRRFFEPMREYAFISSITGWKNYQFNGVTEIVFNNANSNFKTLERINIPKTEFLTNKISFSDKLFQDFDSWKEEIARHEARELNITKIPSIQLTNFNSEFNYNKILGSDFTRFPGQKNILRAKRILDKGNLSKGFRYFQWQQEKNPFSQEVQEKTSFNTFLPGKIKISIDNLYEFVHTRISFTTTGKLTVPVRKNLFEDIKPRIEGKKADHYEADVQDLIHQDGIIEGLLSMLGDYHDEDLLITRTQVSTFGNTKVSINKSLNKEKFGRPENEPIRRHPDSVSLIFRGDGEDKKIGIIIIEAKRGWDEFNHSSKTSKAGYGRGQPLRDLPWFIAKIKEVFPEISDDDIEISCYSLTAHKGEEDTFVIEGEELVRQVPASKVLPFAGLNAKNNSQVYEQIRGIHEDMKVKRTKRS